MEGRKREWIHKPSWGCGPSNDREGYFRRCFAAFREEHKEFDAFLVELHDLLKIETDPDYRNFLLMIEGEAKVNWLTPRYGCILDVFIKLFNLCLSPRQAYKYIKECHRWYIFMSKAVYKVDRIVIQKEKTTSGLTINAKVDVEVSPKRQPPNVYYAFDLFIHRSQIESFIEGEELHPSLIDIHMFCDDERLRDAYMLFCIHPKPPFIENMLMNTLTYIVEEGLFRNL